MKRIGPVMVLSLLCQACATQRPADSGTSCKAPISDFELHAKLGQDPYFSHGVPPPGKQMRVERELCGFRIYVGSGSPDSFGGDLLLVNGDGRIVRVVSRP